MISMEKQFDIIVIGAGMSGSYAAKEFCDKGYKTLLLDRGRDVRHNVDYPTTNEERWNTKYRGRTSHQLMNDNPVLRKCYAFNQETEHFFAKDKDHPYIQVKPFDWIRGYQVGGKSMLWARQVQRWSDYDFEGPKRDDFAVDWPIRYKDLEPWYAEVEHFIGVSGNKDGLDVLPDGDFLKAWDLNCVEKHFQDTLDAAYEDRKLIYGRCAHLTEVRDIHKQQGRTFCQNRTICERGCPFGGYFNANSTLIPWAQRSGNLTLRPHSIVHSLIYDEQSQKVSGVKVIDAQSHEEMVYTAKIIFVNAAAFNTNHILLNSRSDRFPNGLGNDSGVLGKYVAFHNYAARMSATYSGHLDQIPDGRKPTGSYIPRFRNVHQHEMPFKRGWAAYFFADRSVKVNADGIGQDLLDNLDSSTFGDWSIYCGMMGETIPKKESTLTLSSTEKDQWGIPLLEIDIDYDENDLMMKEDFYQEMEVMFKKAGFDNIQRIDTGQAPGLDIHEMGGARMGHHLETSILNKWNQMHLVPNVFVTDGACMTSTSTQNPSLTYMAMTMRSVDYAHTLIKDGKL